MFMTRRVHGVKAVDLRCSTRLKPASPPQVTSERSDPKILAVGSLVFFVSVVGAGTL